MRVFVDASAVVAIIANEPDRQELHEKLKRYKQRHLSGMVTYESVLALQRLSGANFEQMLQLVQGFQHFYAFIREPVAITQKVAERPSALLIGMERVGIPRGLIWETAFPMPVRGT